MDSNNLLQDKAYEHLMKMVLSGQLKKGIIYSETKISEEIGVSRTPLKNALTRLSQDKYVDILPSRGFCIHVITEKDTADTYEVRAAIEGFCVVNLTQNINTKKGKISINKMHETIIFQGKAINNIKKFLKYDNDFHKTLVDFTDNKEFNIIFNNYMHQISELSNETLAITGRSENALKEHIEIYEAILSGDPYKSYSALLKHVSMTKELYLNIVKKINT